MHRDENKQKGQDRSVRSEHLSEVLRDLRSHVLALGPLEVSTASTFVVCSP